MADENREMRITPKFYESLKERGATEFEVAAFGYLEPAVQVMAYILIDDGMAISAALGTLAEGQCELGR